MRLKITFLIQSESDIITNSSSEVFLRIGADDSAINESIYSLLKELLPGNDPELTPHVWRTIGIDEDGYYADTSREYWVLVELPYGIECEEFIEAGITAILEKHFKNNDYIIERI